MTDRIITGPGCNAIHATDTERIEVRIWSFEQIYCEGRKLEEVLDQADTLANWVLTGRKPYRLPPGATRVQPDPFSFHPYDPV